MEFIVNANDENKREIEILGLRCTSGECELDAVPDIPIEDEERFWCDPLAWPDEKVPEDGDSPEIEAGWNMILDCDTAIMELVAINGRLTF